MELVRAPALRPKRRKRYHKTSDSDGFRMCLGHNMRKRTGADADADGGGANAANLCRSIIHSCSALLCSALLCCLRRSETPVPNNVAFNFHRHFVIGAREARRHFPFPMACEVKAVNREVILDTRSPRNNLRRVQTAETMLVCV